MKGGIHMAIKIGHASIDENGKIKNGQAGDQSGKEVCIRTWYSKPWQYILRCKDANKAELMAQACEAGCNNPNIGYDQYQRNTLNTQAQKVGYKLQNIKTKCECDCSSFMTVCAQAAGINIPYNGSNAPTTSTMKTAFTSTGQFDVLNSSKYLTSDAYLKRGDILVKSGSHTVMALQNGGAINNTMTLAIDISSYQGNINFSSVKSSGISKALIKIVDKSMNPEKKFEEYYRGCQNAGIDVIGVYNYSYATTVTKAKTDAQKVLSVLGNRKTTVWLDVEDKSQQGLGTTLKDVINTYQNVIEGAGYTFGVYTGMSFYTSYIKPYASQINCDNWWIARYYNGYNKMGVSQKPNENYNPSKTIGRDICMWQYTSSGQVPGISGNVDINIIYNEPGSSNVSVPTTPPSNSVFIGKVTTSSGNLNIRQGPGTNYPVVGSLPKGKIVQINGIMNDFYMTIYGFVSKDYISQVIGKVSNCTALNMRSTPSSASSSNILTTLKVGDEIALLSEQGNWYQGTDSRGTTGWVSKSYIKVL